jgi:phosphoribosyl-AMP cyclohydrolase
MMNVFDQIKWNDQGLIPAILQDNNSMKVVMMAWMNKEALSKTIETNRCYFYSRSRNKIWLKGEESGNFHDVVSILIDCDFDSLLVKVNVKSGISCHTGRNSCFYNEISDNGDTINIIEEILKDPKLIYKK